MFSDPQTITVDAVAQVLPRISVGNMQATYRKGDGSYELNIAHSANKRERSVARFTANKVGLDPFDATRSRAYTSQCYLVNDAPLNGAGFTDVEQEDNIRGLLTFLLEGNNLAKFLGKES